MRLYRPRMHARRSINTCRATKSNHQIGVTLHTTELFATLGCLVHADDVEPHRLGQWPALADGDLVAGLQANPRRRAVGRRHCVTLFVPIVLFDVVQVCTGQTCPGQQKSWHRSASWLGWSPAAACKRAVPAMNETHSHGGQSLCGSSWWTSRFRSAPTTTDKRSAASRGKQHRSARPRCLIRCEPSGCGCTSLGSSLRWAAGAP